ncbi:MAG: YajQ family cyclic di-GMP-binding protein [Bacillota bacterium]|nr:YajQ family cyclic di-GMP-binding protein [Bacillota bacterium]MDW7685042.1 YajQ family cyclic di-GMP-binding protein [Bacillota bacterium]
MAKNESFDVVSQVNMQEVDNAINQTNKEIGQRYDFKNSKAEVTLEDGNLKIIAEDDFRIRSVVDILQTKLIRRNVPIKNLEYGKVEEAGGGMARQIVGLKQGIDTETAKKMVKDIKGLKLKVQAQIMDDQLRVSGKKRDDLQDVIAFLKENDYNLELQFINYR